MQKNDLLLLREKLSQSRKNEDCEVPNFLRKTYDMLEKEEHKDIISWSDDGKALIIKIPTLFSETVLPLYFKHNNLASYIRQLNMYNFRKRKTHQYDYTFVHEKFRRGEKQLLCQIKRKGTDIMSMLSKVKPQVEEPDHFDLIQENQTLKHVQKTMSEKVQSLEKKLSDTSKFNELLLMQIQILTASGNNGIPEFSLENILTDISRKITQSPNLSLASKFLNSEELLPQLLRNEAPSKTINWPSLQNFNNGRNPKEIKVENVMFSLNSDKAEVNYFENLLNLVSKIDGNSVSK